MSHVDDGTLHAYLDGELPPGEARGVDAHLAQCPDCRTRLEEERALIARAHELLSRAAPPDRELPPFRPGEATPPARLWWQVRLPLAWAATVVLALGAGLYLGSGLWKRNPPAAERSSDLASLKAAPPAPSETIPASKPRAGAAARPARSLPPPPAPAPVAVEEKQLEAAPEAAALRVLDDAVGRARAQDRAMARAVAPSPSASGEGGGYIRTGPPLTVDSARVLLGADPRVVPGLPIRGIYRARMIGYATILVVEQSLDESATITVINGRPSQVTLNAVVVTAATQPDTAAHAEPALRGRAAAPADSPPRGGVAPTDRVDAGLFLDVRGPVSADSLAALRRRLQPLRP